MPADILHVFPVTPTADTIPDIQSLLQAMYKFIYLPFTGVTAVYVEGILCT